MKKIILITTITLLFAFKNSFGGMTVAMNLNSFDVNPKTNGKIIVSSSSATTVTATIVLTRGYNALNNNSSDPVDFRYKIVYIKNGVETQLVAETQLTHNHFSPNMGVLSKDVSVVIPAGLVGGVVTIKHRNYVWSTTSGASKWYPFDRPYFVETGFQTILPAIPPSPYANWISDASVPTIVYDDLKFDLKWNKDLVTSSTVSIEVYQHGVKKEIIASNIPNTGIASIYIFNNIYAGSSHYYGIQLKLISDENPSIFDYSVEKIIQVD